LWIAATIIKEGRKNPRVRSNNDLGSLSSLKAVYLQIGAYIFWSSDVDWLVVLL